MNQAQPRPYRVVVAVDDTEMAETVVEYALDTAARHEPTELHFVRVVSAGALHHVHQGDVDAAHAAIRAQVLGTVDDFGGSHAAIRVHACAGDPVDEIVALAEDVGADLIIVGRHGGLGRPGRLGSVPQKLLAVAHSCLLVVQPDGYQSEVGEPACPRCAEVRAASNGDQWFCAEHHDVRPWRSTSLLSDVLAPVHELS